MAEIVKIDRAGRIVIPKGIRKELGVKGGSGFLLTTRSGGQLLLQKLDVETIAKGLERELAGKDIDAIVKKVKEEINAKIKARYPDLFG